MLQIQLLIPKFSPGNKTRETCTTGCLKSLRFFFCYSISSSCIEFILATLKFCLSSWPPTFGDKLFLNDGSLGVRVCIHNTSFFRNLYMGLIS